MAPRVCDVAFAALDFESAGTTPGATDVPVQVGMAGMRDGVIAPESFFRSYIAAARPITWSAARVHGIRAEDLQNAPPMLELWPRFQEHLKNRWIVCHGAATEKRFLRAFPLHGFGPWVDTLMLSRAAWPDLPDHSLGALCRHFHLEESVRQLCPDLQWHDALFDAVGSLVLLRHFCESHGLREISADCLLRPNVSTYHKNLATRVSRPPC